MASVLHGTWGIFLTLTVPSGTHRVKVSNHPEGSFFLARGQSSVHVSSSSFISGKLPVVLGALSSLLGVLGGAVDSLHDDGVLLVEGHGLDKLVHLVPHLGGGPGHAAQLVLVTTGVEKETHASSEVRRGDSCLLLIGSASNTSATHQPEHDDGNLEGDEDPM